jgi:hypothetical protein
VDSCPKAEPREQRGLPLYTLASRLQKQKPKSNPYMVIFNFIGYFALVLCDFPLSGATWPSSCSDFSDFISLLCHPYLPATSSGLRPRLFSSDPPPCYTMILLITPSQVAGITGVNLQTRPYKALLINCLACNKYIITAQLVVVKIIVIKILLCLLLGAPTIHQLLYIT